MYHAAACHSPSTPLAPTPNSRRSSSLARPSRRGTLTLAAAIAAASLGFLLVACAADRWLPGPVGSALSPLRAERLSRGVVVLQGEPSTTILSAVEATTATTATTTTTTTSTSTSTNTTTTTSTSTSTITSTTTTTTTSTSTTTVTTTTTTTTTTSTLAAGETTGRKRLTDREKKREERDQRREEERDGRRDG